MDRRRQPVRIELDRNGLVRKAVMRSDVNGHRTQFDVTSNGTVRRGELLLAKSGVSSGVCRNRPNRRTTA